METQLAKFVEQFGVPTAILIVVIVYFIRRDMEREKQALERETQLNKRVDELENYIRTRLDTLVERATMAIQQQADANRELAQTCKAAQMQNRN